MKKIIIISLFIVSAYCSAQNPILNIHTSMPDIANAYYKDIENFQNQFVGTWVYSDAVKTIRFKFIKKEMFYFQGFSKNYYEDYLVGDVLTPIKQEYYSKFRFLIKRLIFSLLLDVYPSSISP